MQSSKCNSRLPCSPGYGPCTGQEYGYIGLPFTIAHAGLLRLSVCTSNVAGESNLRLSKRSVRSTVPDESIREYLTLELCINLCIQVQIAVKVIYGD